MGLKRTLIYLVIALVVWRAGSPVLRYVFGLLSSGLGALFGSSGSATADPTSLRAAIRNVTTDYDQLSTLVQEFFRQTSQLRQDDTSEALFRDFLGQRATRSRPSLEQALDWILALYKVVWPVLVVFLVSKLNSGKSRLEDGDMPLEANSQLTSNVRRLPNGDSSPTNRHEKLRSHGATNPSSSRQRHLATSTSSLS